MASAATKTVNGFFTLKPGTNVFLSSAPHSAPDISGIGTAHCGFVALVYHLPIFKSIGKPKNLRFRYKYKENIGKNGVFFCQIVRGS